MPGPLALPSLEIHNFRGLRELKIARLGRANLIVGKNNVGKTSVLEAIRLFARPGDPRILTALLKSRGQLSLRDSTDGRAPWDAFTPVERLFSDFDKNKPGLLPISIGPRLESSSSLVLRLERNPKLRRLAIELLYQLGDVELLLPLHDVSRLSAVTLRANKRVNWSEISRRVLYVSPNGLNSGLFGALWDAVSLSPRESEIIEAMRVVVPEIEGVNLVLDGRGNGAKARVPRRSAFIKLHGRDERVTLREMGDGINRVFGIALALVNAKDGFLLIDEIENGLHYSIQADVWRFIFQVAASLNVQVFATTHSSDCVKSFQAASSESEEDGVLIRLSRKDGRVRAVELDEDELEIAVDNTIEVR